MGNIRRVQAAAWFLTLCTIVFTMSEQLIAACLTPPGDTNGDGAANVLDVQCNILMNLWSLNGQIGPVPQCMGANPQPTLVPDHNCDNVINISDTVLSVTFALLAPLNGDLDGNINQCVDTCESDLDGDGDFDFLDCAPLNGNVFKGAAELCNGYDDDCDGVSDEPSATTVAQSCNDNDACSGTETCTAVQIGTGIAITELQINPGAGLQPHGEWIEIFNGGAAPVNVRGFKLKDNHGELHTIDPGGALFIPPGGTLVFAANTDMAQNGGVRAHYQYSGFNLDDSADEVILLNSQGNELDRVDYDTNNGWTITPGSSIAVVDHSSNNNQPGIWATSSAGYGTDGLKGTPSGPNYDVYPSYCADGEPVDCSYLNDSCNDSACDSTDGSCSAVPKNDGGGCDDGNSCTQTDTCNDGVCVGGNPVSCGEAALCYTDPVCNPDTGDCETSPLTNGTTCSDSLACTVSDSCTDGMCIGIPNHLACDDGVFCTLDLCSPGAADADAAGCVVDPTGKFGTECDDDNVCTYPDVCDFDGTCAPGFGVTCNDKNSCTDDFCDPVDGCQYVPNTAACNDGIACTTGDVCGGGSCAGTVNHSVCDDGEFCTQNLCIPGSTDADSQGCVLDPLANFGTPCDDENECTYPDVCDFDGTCAPGFGVTCNDKNPCTDDSCHPTDGCIFAPNTNSCDDGIECTQNDICTAGVCIGEVSHDACEDGEFCTQNLCDADDPGADTSGCVTDPLAMFGTPCDDGSECTYPDVCDFDGTCAPGFGVTCNDNNPCTDDSCDPEIGCVYAPNTEPCDDNNACTLDDQCSGGDCVGGEAPDCDDDNPCTDDGCDPESGCTHAVNSDPCDDNDACTLDDQCNGGDCVGGQAPDCDDDNPCTDDDCDSQSGCTNTANLEPCDDNNACTLDDQCSGGDCVGGEAPDCDDDNPCTDDGCDPTDGCYVTNNTEPCDDGIDCTVDDTCSEGTCIATPSDEFCDDGIFCTLNTCDVEHPDADAQGCVTDGLAMFDTPCDDGSECTWPDVCDFDGNCEPGFGVTCNDKNPCTDDFCDDAEGCMFVPNTEACDDGIGCTIDDVCTAGACLGTPSAEACEDGIFCTLNTCDVEHPDADTQGCVTDALAMFGTPCDDGSECTWPDVCDFDGNCEPGFGVTCNDKNPCTDDFCDDADGCMFIPNTEACDDGIGCTIDDVCTDGTCFGTPSADACEDGIFCTLNTCDVEHPDSDDQGCVTDGLAMFGVPCDDGSECTWPDVCDFVGNCEPGFGVTCNDLNPCTDDYCDDAEGCIFADNTEVCDDGIGCTVDDGCQAGVCVGTASDSFCEDGNVCISNSCDSQHPDADADGCVADPFAAFGQLCDDGDGCTFPDVCDFDGNCTPGFGIDCDDGASCTIDSCDSETGECVYVITECADDGLACTVDYCDPTDPNAQGDGCVHDAFPLFGTLCDDGNECTWPDACDFDGTCVPGFDVECDDGNPDTLDSCDPDTGECIYTPIDCDDGDVCTLDEFDPVSMSCTYTVVECDDGQFCTADSCDASHPLADASGCVYDPFANFGVLCDDGNECTWPDACDLDGTCAPGFDVECDDGDICTTDFCDPASGGCISQPSTEPCDDGIACTIDDVCSNGTCQGAPSDTVCDDDNVCSLDICDPASGDADALGCIYDTLSMFASPCDDGDVCSEPDLCDFFGGCEPGFPVVCDDGDVCTNDYCDPVLGCISSGIVLAENFETGAAGWTTGILNGEVSGWTLTDVTGGTDPIGFGSITFGTPNDGDLLGYENSYLQSPTFSSTGGATLTFDSYSSNEFNNPYDAESVQISYDGGNNWEILIPSTDSTWWEFFQSWVTFTVDIPAASGTNQTVLRFVYDTVDGCCGFTSITGWYIDNVVVVGSAGIDCNDNDGCTIDACDPANGCYYTNVDCDDDDVCTQDDCNSDFGNCLYSLVLCDDNDGCTIDSCDPTQGCVYDSVNCDDGDVCTLDECDQDTGMCLYSSVACDDGEFCTLDYCDPTDIFAGPDGCVHDGLSMFAQSCDDGNPCTEPDLCDFFGFCEPGFGVICNDNNPCTADSCDPDTGECVFAPTSGSCNDGIACTINDTCTAGSCAGTPSHAACEDGDPCTTNLCSPPTGCVVSPTTTWYVDAAKAGLPQNGTSWATAYATVQAAVDAAQTGDAVWVRTGTYKPAGATANVVVMKTCVNLYGGFAGNETTLAARPMLPTTLSGDFDNSNSATAADSLHVVTAASNTRLDGFVVTRGNATSQGGCVYGISTNYFTIDNCTVTQCVAAFNGGGAYLTGSPVTIEDSLFSLNVAGPGNSADGGGFFVTSGNFTLQRSTFVQNVANHQGGAGYLSTSNTVIRDCDFEANTVQQGGGQVAGGGAIWATNGTTAIYNSEFISNQCIAGSGGWGGALLFFGATPTVTNCTFAENTAPSPGHAIGLFSGSAPTISNSVLWSSVAGAQLGNGGGGAPVIQFSCLSGGWAGAGSGNADLAIPAGNPFTLGPQGQYYLKHLNVGGAPFTSACVNLGNNTLATNAGIPWQTMTTRIDLVNDATPVDAGRHY
ncbi:MAG: lamin tail domain-containing protein [Myxococcales bacterium]|nr:lamin tail domain-containing protein [Myxococcales bacterium]